jgi:hypothetical protein
MQVAYAPTKEELEAVPLVTKRLVAKCSGASFREVAHVITSPLTKLEEGQVLVRMTHVGINGGCETFRARAEHACASRGSDHHHTASPFLNAAVWDSLPLQDLCVT